MLFILNLIPWEYDDGYYISNVDTFHIYAETAEDAMGKFMSEDERLPYIGYVINRADLREDLPPGIEDIKERILTRVREDYPSTKHWNEFLDRYEGKEENPFRDMMPEMIPFVVENLKENNQLMTLEEIEIIN